MILRLSVKGKAINMNYVNYDVAIVEKHKVQLVGWPSAIPFANPSTVGTVDNIRSLRGALIAGECKWIAQSKCQQDHHATMLKTRHDQGEVIGKKRKQRLDQGKKRTHKGGNEGSSDEQPQPKKKHMRKSAQSQLPPTYQSCGLVNEVFDEED